MCLRQYRQRLLSSLSAHLLQEVHPVACQQGKTNMLIINCMFSILNDILILFFLEIVEYKATFVHRNVHLYNHRDQCKALFVMSFQNFSIVSSKLCLSKCGVYQLWQGSGSYESEVLIIDIGRIGPHLLTITILKCIPNGVAIEFAKQLSQFTPNSKQLVCLKFNTGESSKSQVRANCED